MDARRSRRRAVVAEDDPGPLELFLGCLDPYGVLTDAHLQRDLLTGLVLYPLG